MLLLQHSLTLDTLDQHMVHIPAGSIDMGSDREENEQPVHRVSLNALELCRYPVTQALWEEIMGENPSRFKGSNRPVEQVSWNDAQKFIKKLNGCTEGGYRLPKEAEWEYAARGGPLNLNLTYAGSEKLEELGWYRQNSFEETHDIGQKLPNALGLYDMSGNVEEWCQDWYSRAYYSSSPEANPKGPNTGGLRVLRGGSWGSGAGYCRVANRSLDVLDGRRDFIGCRLARSH